MPIYGDAEAATCEILRDAPALNAIGGFTATTDLVGYETGERWLHVSRIGGTPTHWMRRDNAEISVDVYAPSKGEAHDMSQAARDALMNARGYTGNGLRVEDTRDGDGLMWAADELTADAHYRFSVTLITRPQ